MATNNDDVAAATHSKFAVIHIPENEIVAHKSADLDFIDKGSSTRLNEHETEFEFKAPLQRNEEIDVTPVSREEDAYNHIYSSIKPRRVSFGAKESEQRLLNLESIESHRDSLLSDNAVSTAPKHEEALNKKNYSKGYKLRYNRTSKLIECTANVAHDGSKERGCLSQFKYQSFYRALFAEVLGTFILVLYVCSFGLPIADVLYPELPEAINGALGSGLLVATLVWVFGNVSGANLNPAVSIALLVAGESNITCVLCYIVCQLLGSTLAVVVLAQLIPEHLHESTVVHNAAVSLQTTQTNQISSNASLFVASNLQTGRVLPPAFTLGLTTLHKDVSANQGIGIEAICAFILMLTVFACIDEKRNDVAGSFPLTIGFTIVIGALFGGKFTGASMNPARSFGPALVMNNWSNHHVYWIGPILGTTLAACIYKVLIYKKKKHLNAEYPSLMVHRNR